MMLMQMNLFLQRVSTINVNLVDNLVVTNVLLIIVVPQALQINFPPILKAYVIFLSALTTMAGNRLIGKSVAIPI